MEPKFTWNIIKKAADSLDLAPCIISALCLAEATPSGFLPSGRPYIFFDGRVFRGELMKRGLDPQRLSGKHPHILLEHRPSPIFGEGEKDYERLTAAMDIHEEAALAATAWGTFQIMGRDYKDCGYLSVFDFVFEHLRGPEGHLAAFCGFIKKGGLDRILREENWSAFARARAGRNGHEKNYGQRLARAYDQCRLKRGPTLAANTRSHPLPRGEYVRH